MSDDLANLRAAAEAFIASRSGPPHDDAALTRHLETIERYWQQMQPEDAIALLDRLDAAERERDELRGALADLLEMVPPCDTDNPRVKQWCMAHQAKRCKGDAVRSRAAALLRKEPTP